MISCNMICGVALSSIILHSALSRCSRVQAFGSAYFLAEFIILDMPLLLSMTLFAEASGALSSTTRTDGLSPSY
ncbi:uncharacterized protein F5147DRAFT_664321 [Suillus discolor]|uniref:Uncharacterized protein n=1 Tax=Suillus discolor TaxID=1912936 RepID=A0A9P7K094_9AGAM|nr:uncharacterized protein F5147DRAFT_664321 [Suillus discolor]KAG2119495.1 hypothetical protein F5147DRAFT_664321 [Suillus discolor]